MENIELQKEMLSKINSKSTLDDISSYVSKMIELREFDESIIETLILLVEEVGELSKAIRYNYSNIKIDMSNSQMLDIKEEIADIFFVLVSISNNLGINLLDAFKEKEERNINRVWKNK